MSGIARYPRLQSQEYIQAKKRRQSRTEIMPSPRIVISTRVVVAYAVLAAVILVLVTGGVLYSRTYIESNTWEIGELQTISQSVEAAGANPIEAEIIVGFGKMAISGGADELMELAFTSNVAGMQPSVTYQVNDDVGALQVMPGTLPGVPDPRHFDEYQNEWNLRFDDQAPLDLKVELGTGLGDFDLSRLSLTDLEIEVGTGEVTIDLRGNWQRGFYTFIDGGTGKMTLLLPSTIGVRVDVESGIGAVNIQGLEQSGDSYVNSAYGDTDITLYIEAEVGMGELNLVVGDLREE